MQRRIMIVFENKFFTIRKLKQFLNRKELASNKHENLKQELTSWLEFIAEKYKIDGKIDY